MTTIFFVIAIAFSIVFAASNMSMAATHITSSGGRNLHQNNGDSISTLQSHKPCPNGSAPDVNGKCQTTVCPNGSAPDVNGKCQTTVCPNGSAPDVNGSCTRTPSRPGQPSSSLENNNSTIVSQPSQLLPSSPTTTCPDGSSPDANGKCTPFPLPPI
ncbi:MAG: hypothetical protein JO297_13380 [Nitrososphaeraceae archaeon]|nr:hypothetical protein [Nitrososphaeraceae archaeon]